MKFRFRLASLAGAVALAGASLLATGGQANAAYSECPAGALCAYVGANGAGSPGPVYDDNTNLQQYTKFANVVSLYNHGNNCNVRIYYGLSYTGANYVLARGYANDDLTGYVWYHHVYSNDWCV
ncbi:peptidase inhibitor family I36 protein [Streptomyces sp. NPDC005799]|uniref:peptidase inhibitor family I36 protein n=1 Tax=Streptomyces sp. NPDC005799 TaxID=3154678 RepID=UPI0033CACBC5